MPSFVSFWSVVSEVAYVVSTPSFDVAEVTSVVSVWLSGTKVSAACAAARMRTQQRYITQIAKTITANVLGTVPAIMISVFSCSSDSLLLFKTS